MHFKDFIVNCEMRGIGVENMALALDEFVEELCQLLPLRQMPPLHVLNLYVWMAWKPFQLPKDQYDELVQRLALEPLDAPETVASEEKWEAWCTEKLLGVPAEELLPKLQEFYQVERKWLLAAERGAKVDEARLHVEYMRLSAEIDRIIDRYAKS